MISSSKGLIQVYIVAGTDLRIKWLFSYTRLKENLTRALRHM
jgi:hypothetical protein